MWNESQSHIQERQERLRQLNSRLKIFFARPAWKRVEMIVVIVGIALFFGLLGNLERFVR